MIADAPAVATASGWESTPDGIHMGDPSEEGPTQLRENLAQIAYTVPLIDMGAELAMPYMISGISRLINSARNTNNFVKSRKAIHALEKIAGAGNDLPLMHGADEAKGDITGLHYGNLDYVRKAKQIGNTAKINYADDIVLPTKERASTAEDARAMVEYAQNAMKSKRDVLPPTNEVMEQIAKDAKRLKSGNKVALIDDYALSTDSYPLYQATLLRNHLSGNGAIQIVKDGNTYRMVRLNHYGIKPNATKSIDKSIDMMRRMVDPEIPDRITIAGQHFVPVSMFTKFSQGGKKSAISEAIEANKIQQIKDAIEQIKRKRMP